MMLTSFDNFSFLKILSFLKAHKSEFLSGQDMSDVLKISRVAVCKDIKKNRSLGYKIESKQNLGYRLVDTTKLLLPWEVTQNLNTEFLGKRVYYFDTIDTTQNFAMKIASKKNDDIFTHFPDHQSIDDVIEKVEEDLLPYIQQYIPKKISGI